MLRKNQKWETHSHETVKYPLNRKHYYYSFLIVAVVSNILKGLF
jgi:hypothetical protein